LKLCIPLETKRGIGRLLKPITEYHKIQLQKRGKFERFADVLGRWSGITVKQAKQLIE